MPDAVKFYFDPVCPWSYQTSRWARRLEELQEITLDWGLFSLEVVNRGRDDVQHADVHPKSAPALRTCVLVGKAAGAGAVGRLYATLGRRVHEQGEPLEEAATVTAALRDAGLDASLFDEAVGDEQTWAQVCDEHNWLVERTRSFGVPTLVLEGGQGPAIFGPVLSVLPSDEEAVELWRHVRWLARYENFSELKRERALKVQF